MDDWEDQLERIAPQLEGSRGTQDMVLLKGHGATVEAAHCRGERKLRQSFSDFCAREICSQPPSMHLRGVLKCEAFERREQW